MYWPYDFTVGANTLDFVGGPLYVKAQNGMMSYRPTSISTPIETLDGTYYDPYEGVTIPEIPQTVTFQTIYIPAGATSDVHASAVGFWQASLKSNYFGQSGTLKGYLNITTPVTYSCTARCIGIAPVLSQNHKGAALAYFNFTFSQITTFS